MGLGRVEPEAAERPETTEDWPQANRRSTTNLTRIRPRPNRPDPGNDLDSLRSIRTSSRFLTRNQPSAGICTISRQSWLGDLMETPGFLQGRAPERGRRRRRDDRTQGRVVARTSPVSPSVGSRSIHPRVGGTVLINQSKRRFK